MTDASSHQATAEAEIDISLAAGYRSNTSIVEGQSRRKYQKSIEV